MTAPSPATRAQMDALIAALARAIATDARLAAAADRVRADRLRALFGRG